MYPRPLYDAHLRNRAQQLLAVSRNDKATAEALRISYSQVKRYRANIQAYGQCLPPSNGISRGRPRKLTRAIEDDLLEWASGQDQSPYLDEMKAYLEDQFGVV